MPRKVFVAGEILTAADVNTNLMDQSVMVFDDATARTTAIPTPVEGMVTYLKDTDAVDKFDGSAFVTVAPRDGFTASTTITATDSSFPVPALGSPIVKVTVVGGGGGGGTTSVAGGAGGVSSFDAGGGNIVTASGGAGGGTAIGGVTGNAGLRAANHGGAFVVSNSNPRPDGNSGVIVVGYLNLTGVSTVDVTVGAGGTASGDAGLGGRGEVILEFVAA